MHKASEAESKFHISDKIKELFINEDLNLSSHPIEDDPTLQKLKRDLEYLPEVKKVKDKSSDQLIGALATLPSHAVKPFSSYLTRRFAEITQDNKRLIDGLQQPANWNSPEQVERFFSLMNALKDRKEKLEKLVSQYSDFGVRKELEKMDQVIRGNESHVHRLLQDANSRKLMSIQNQIERLQKEISKNEGLLNSQTRLPTTFFDPSANNPESIAANLGISATTTSFLSQEERDTIDFLRNMIEFFHGDPRVEAQLRASAEKIKIGLGPTIKMDAILKMWFINDQIGKIMQKSEQEMQTYHSILDGVQKLLNKNNDKIRLLDPLLNQLDNKTLIQEINKIKSKYQGIPENFTQRNLIQYAISLSPERARAFQMDIPRIVALDAIRESRREQIRLTKQKTKAEQKRVELQKLNQALAGLRTMQTEFNQIRGANIEITQLSDKIETQKESIKSLLAQKEMLDRYAEKIADPSAIDANLTIQVLAGVEANPIE